jgi:anti-sigma B factor antagonist
MLMTNVLLNVRFATPSVSVIEIQGEVNASAEKKMMEAFTQAQGPQVQAVLLDFKKMDFMNSSGIGLIITLLIRANRLGQKLVAIGLNPHFQRIFELTRLHEVIPVFSGEGEALAVLQGA